MQVIHAYTLRPTGRQLIAMPPGSKIVSAYIHDDLIQIAAIVDVGCQSEFLKERKIVVLGAGEPVPEGNLQFIGTVKTPLQYVWHVFELIP